jgi:hypothetical protein
MASVFLSHSSKDAEFASWLATELRRCGHAPWLDEWEIKVGECIVTRLGQGIAGSDAVVLVMTPEAVTSGWVGREWKTAYWNEINRNKVLLLPVMLRGCEVPDLIRTKKYADFRGDHQTGLRQLLAALPVSKKENDGARNDTSASLTEEVNRLVELVHSNGVPISQCIAKGMSLARRIGATDLAAFCQRELTGWDESKPPENPPMHRAVEVFIASAERPNPLSAAWNGDGANMFSYMESHPNKYKKGTVIMPFPISMVEQKPERDPSRGVISWSQPLRMVTEDGSGGDAPVWFYARGTAYLEIVRRLRVEFTKRLLVLLQ